MAMIDQKELKPIIHKDKIIFPSEGELRVMTEKRVNERGYEVWSFKQQISIALCSQKFFAKTLFLTSKSEN